MRLTLFERLVLTTHVHQLMMSNYVKAVLEQNVNFTQLIDYCSWRESCILSKRTFCACGRKSFDKAMLYIPAAHAEEYPKFQMKYFIARWHLSFCHILFYVVQMDTDHL